jgi:DNA-binding HxlR family transcriptional regulator
MPINRKIIELEGQRGTLQIMLALQKYGEILYGNLYNNKSLVEISNNYTAKRALDVLLRYGLVVQKPYEGKKAIYYRLSKKGERFAKLLNEIESLLE